MDMISDCGQGRGRLTGFKNVELRMGYLHKTMERMEFVIRMYTHLNEDIAVTLGEGKLLDDERCLLDLSSSEGERGGSCAARKIDAG